MDIRPLCGGGCRPPLRGRNTCAQSRGPAGSEPRTQRELAGERCGAYAGGATRTREPRLGCVPTPPAFIPHLRGRRLAACDVRWDLERHGLRDPRAADCERPKPPEDASWRRPEHGGGNELTSSRQAWGRGPERGGVGSRGGGAGHRAGRACHRRARRGIWGDRPPDPRGARSRLWDSCGASVRTPRCARAEAGGWRAWESAR